MRHHPTVLAALLAILPLSATQAQSCHALTGTWRLDPAASRLGSGLSFNPRYAVTAITLRLDQRERGLAQDWHLTGPHLDEVDRYVTGFDGALTPTGTHSALNAMPEAARGVWENCTLIENGRASLFGQVVWTQTRFVVSPDGARLTLDQDSHSDLGDIARSLAFVKVAP